MADEARKALAKLGSKLRLYARSSGHIQVIDSAAWGIVLLDLYEVELRMAELEDYKKLAEKRLDLWSEDYHKLRGELKNLRDYKGGLGEAMLERAKLSPGLDSRFITIDRRTWIECAEEVVQLEIKYAEVNHWAMEQQGRADNAEKEVQALEDLLGSAGNLLLETYGKMMEPLRERHAKLVVGRKEETECTCSVAGHAIGCPFYVPQIEKPLSQIYIGFDRAHDKGDETSVRFYRRNDDRSITILAELKGEAAEYIAELEDNFNDLSQMSHRFSCILERATGGRMSKTNYTKEAMYREIDGHIRDLCDEALKELKDSLPKRNLRWDGERRNGEGAYVCIYCDVQLPRLGAIVHKADCIQATRF